MRIVSGAFLLLATSSCVQYDPRWIDTAATARTLRDERLDGVEVASIVRQIAPRSEWTSSEPWDVVSLYAAALKSNPRVAEARAINETAAAIARASRSAPSSTLTLMAEYANASGDSSPWLAGIGTDIPVESRALRGARLTTADVAAFAARYDYVEACWTARMALRRALAEQALASRETVELERLRDLRRTILLLSERRMELGEADRNELETRRMAAALDVQKLADAQSREINARHGVASALGVTTNALAKVVLGDTPIPRTATPIDVAVFRDEALLARSDVAKAVAAYAETEAALHAEVARQFPEIHLGPGYVWERGLTKLPFNLGLVLPPLDGNRKAIAAAEARRSEAAIRVERVQSEAIAAVDASEAALAAARDALEFTRRDVVPTATRLAARADVALRAGLIDRSEWASAQAGQRESALAEISAARRVEEALLALEDAVRRPLAGAELAIEQFAPLKLL